LFVVACVALSEQEYQKAWEEFKWEHKKLYSDSEGQYRYTIFKNNLHFINSHNGRQHSFTLAMNHLGDMTNEEINGLNNLNITKLPLASLTRAQITAPDTWDWRTKGAVTGVKDQGQCGSCWSFSATGSIEGAWFLSKGSLVSLSEQNLVDCSTAYGNQGCRGGLMDSAFKYVIANHGLDTEMSYAYTATGPNSCKFNVANVGATISGFKDIPSGDENSLMNAVAMTPVSVAIDASKSTFHFYNTGVYYDASCSSTQLDHGVLAVGYGTENGSEYWLVKNSWGAAWGQAGYIKMSKNKKNNCGIATMASYPSI